MECHACHQKGHFARECQTNATKGRSGNGQGGDGDGREQTIYPRAYRREQGQLPGRHGTRGVDPGRSDLEEVGLCRR